MKRLFFLFIGCCCAINLLAQKPKWVGNTPQAGNATYKFVEIISYGTSIEAARQGALNTLAHDQQLNNAVRVNIETGMLTHIDQRVVKGELQDNSYEQMDVKVQIAGEEYQLQALRVDEYLAKADKGNLELHTLYMVALTDRPQFDTPTLSTRYGAAPVAMSIIPGVGQWYKGSKVKGVSIFAAEALSVGAIILCENQRASYVKKATENPRQAKEYGNMADNWATGRNISIGIAAGVWVYNIIDAAVSRGARRVILKNRPTTHMTLAPFVVPKSGAGVSLTYNF